MGVNFKNFLREEENGKTEHPNSLKSSCVRQSSTNCVPRSKHKTRRCGNVYLGVDVLRVCEDIFMCVRDV